MISEKDMSDYKSDGYPQPERVAKRYSDESTYATASFGVTVDSKAKATPYALDIQVGGGHYKNKAIQPIEYIHANGLNYSEGAIVKYITRWRGKNGIEDLEKIKHYVDLLIAMERKYGKLDN